MTEKETNEFGKKMENDLKRYVDEKISSLPRLREERDFREMKKHIKDMMDIQEEIITRLNKKSSSFHMEPIVEKFKSLNSIINSNRRDIDNLISEIERGENIKPYPKSDMRKELDEKFFDVNSRLEEYRKNLLDEISRVENKRGLPPPPPAKNESVKELREEMMSRIRGLEEEIYELRKKMNSRGALVVE